VSSTMSSTLLDLFVDFLKWLLSKMETIHCRQIEVDAVGSPEQESWHESSEAAFPPIFLLGML
jgi:hypothetical protein